MIENPFDESPDLADFWCRVYSLASPFVRAGKWHDRPSQIRPVFNEDTFEFRTESDQTVIERMVAEAVRDSPEQFEIEIPPLRGTKLRLRVRRFGAFVSTFILMHEDGNAVVGVISNGHLDEVEDEHERSAMKEVAVLLGRHYGKRYAKLIESFERHGVTWFEPPSHDNNADWRVELLLIARMLMHAEMYFDPMRMNLE